MWQKANTRQAAPACGSATATTCSVPGRSIGSVATTRVVWLTRPLESSHPLALRISCNRGKQRGRDCWLKRAGSVSFSAPWPFRCGGCKCLLISTAKIDPSNVTEPEPTWTTPFGIPVEIVNGESCLGLRQKRPDVAHVRLHFLRVEGNQRISFADRFQEVRQRGQRNARWANRCRLN